MAPLDIFTLESHHSNVEIFKLFWMLFILCIKFFTTASPPLATDNIADIVITIIIVSGSLVVILETITNAIKTYQSQTEPGNSTGMVEMAGWMVDWATALRALNLMLKF